MDANARQKYFQEAVKAILGNWTALRLVADQQGPAVREAFVPWLMVATAQWFQENRDLTPQEVEGFLEDILATEFNAGVEDGSLEQVSRCLCDLYGVCMSSKEAGEVEERLSTLPKGPADLSACRIVDGGAPAEVRPADAANGTDDVSDLAEKLGSVLDTVEEETTVVGKMERPGRAQPNEDGWTTVPQRRKKK